MKWGRARLTVTYDDGTAQTIHYNVTKPAQQAVADMGRFLTTKAWFTDETDPFQRAPSVMTYDRANNRIVHAGHARVGRRACRTKAASARGWPR